VLAVGAERGPHWSLALIAAAATGGYLAWNWHPAKVFMGDSGSIPLGFLLGWLMLDLAFQGYWAAATILPAYFAADATWTLVKRILRGERPWKAHREHFYQRAVLGGATPPEVVRLVCIANGILIVLAVASAKHPLLSLLAAAAVVIALLHRLQTLAEKRPS
jgi:UDP-N-acetylmuramyl pentapeptide phosphotransferase/UDP-N-acetylglucosamine-1-phosphate transferase